MAMKTAHANRRIHHPEIQESKKSGRDHADQIHSPVPDAVRDVAGKRDGNEGDAGRRHHRGENEVPQLYATLFSAFYLPLLLMLAALILRGVAFEFRYKAERMRPVWDAGFAGGRSCHGER